MAEEHIRSCGAEPAFKGYRPAPSMSPFPGTICASINEEIVHGFPSDGRRLAEGDILSVDVGACLDGYYGDAACTYPVGAVSAERRKLLDVTEVSLNRAIAAALGQDDRRYRTCRRVLRRSAGVRHRPGLYGARRGEEAS